MFSMDNLRAVRLRTLDSEGNPVGGYASGFFLFLVGQTYLYTAWHVVTGLDWVNLRDNELPTHALRRSTISVETALVEVRQPGVTAIGGRREFKFPLYDEAGMPLWQQDRQSRSDYPVPQLGCLVPKFSDIVRIPVALPDEYREALVVELPSRSDTSAPSIGAAVTIFGYPFGFSSGPEGWIEAVAVTRHVAGAWKQRNPGIALIEPAAYPVMSGAPVYVEAGHDRRDLVGVYGGAIYPDRLGVAKGMTTSEQPNLGVFYSLWWFHSIGLGANQSQQRTT